MPRPPVPVGGVFGSLGGGLAYSRSGQRLFTSNPGSHTISTFAREDDCNLTLLGQSRAPFQPNDLQESPDGVCLAVTSPQRHAIALYDLTGALPRLVRVVPIPGGLPTGLEFSARVRQPKAYVALANADGSTVLAYDFIALDTSGNVTCALENPVSTVDPQGSSSNVLGLTPGNECLFVVNQPSGISVPPSDSGRDDPQGIVWPDQTGTSLTTFRVDPDTGDLALVGTLQAGEKILAAAVAFAPLASGATIFYTGIFDPPLVVTAPVDTKSCVLRAAEVQFFETGRADGRLLRNVAVFTP